jgi:hypothetical protein
MAPNRFGYLFVILGLPVQYTTMGLSISTLFNSLASLVRWSKDQDVRILMLGLDSAGKVRHIHPAHFFKLTWFQTMF